MTPLDPEADGVTRNGTDPERLRHVKLTPASQIRSERVRWLWRPRLPLRSLSVIAGEKGLGKSLLTNAHLPALATRGKLSGELEGQPIDVLLCTAEDDWRTVVKPRLVANDADLDRVHRVQVGDKDGESLLTLPDDVALLEGQIARLRKDGRHVGMLVVDPIGSFLASSTDTHRDASVRRALAPLAALADRADLVVVVVAHLNKDESSRLINRVSGAGAFVNAARSVLMLARCPDDPNGEQGNERVLVHVSSNWGSYATSLAARVEVREVLLDDGARADIGFLVLTGESTVGVEDLQHGSGENGGADVEEAIAAALIEGARPSLEVKKQVGKEVECSSRTVGRAAGRMGDRGELVITSEGFPRRTTWRLGDGPDGSARSHDNGAAHSQDNGAAPVRSSPNSTYVLTDSHAVLTEDSLLSEDSGATPRARTREGEPNSALVDEAVRRFGGGS